MKTKRIILIIFISAAALRVVTLWLAPLWYDENFTLILSRLPFARMIAATAGDTHPPLWYVITWAWVHAFPSLPVWTLRIPSALCSIAALFVFDRILVEMKVSQRIQIVALVLMAILPVNLYYAMEARMYALLELEVLLCFWSILKLDRRALVLAAAGTALMYTQNYGGFYLAALALAWLSLHPSRKFSDLFNALVTFALPVLLWLPWLGVMLGQMRGIAGHYWILGFSFGYILQTLSKSVLMSQSIATREILPVMVFYAWLMVGLIAAIRHRTGYLFAVLTLAFLPFGLAVAASYAWQPVLLFRPLIGSVPFLVLLLAAPADDFKNLRHWLLALIFILPILVTRDWSIYAYMSESKGSGVTASILGYLKAHWQPGDVIYISGDGAWVNYTPYTDMPIIKLAECAPTMGALTDATRQAIGETVHAYPGGRAWLLWTRDPLTPACELASIAPLVADPSRPDHVIWWDELQKYGIWLLK